MDQGLLVVTSGSAAKGSTMGLEVAGSGPVQLPFPFPPSFLACVVHNNVFLQIPFCMIVKVSCTGKYFVITYTQYKLCICV